MVPCRGERHRPCPTYLNRRWRSLVFIWPMRLRVLLPLLGVWVSFKVLVLSDVPLWWSEQHVCSVLSPWDYND